MTIATEIEWHETFVVPGLDHCKVLCAIEEHGEKKVIAGYWSSHFGEFLMDTHHYYVIKPARWAYMPDFPEEP